jgi:hypothetical protein
MSNPAWIRISNRGVGNVTLVTNAVYGEGGPHDARLVLPLRVTMEAQPREEMLAVVSLTSSLHLATSASDANQLGPIVTLNLLPEFRCRSLPSGSNSSEILARFPLTDPLIAKLEAHRHANPEAMFVGALRLSATVVWVSQTLNNYPLSPRDQTDHPFSGGTMGMYSFLAPFWTTSIEDLDVCIPASTWVGAVLPGWGLDHLRLIEVALPRTGGFFPDTVVGHFDAAKRAFDMGQYRPCMVACRDVRYEVEQHLGATEKNPIGDIIEQRLGLAPGSQQRDLVNAAWRALRFETNVAPHIPGGPRVTEADARACLHLTAVVLEYVGRLCGA